MVNCVKLCFAILNYDCYSFYCLPIDMSAGSRELLLAFSWLLADTEILSFKLIEFINKTIFRDEFDTPIQVCLILLYVTYFLCEYKLNVKCF